MRRDGRKEVRGQESVERWEKKWRIGSNRRQKEGMEELKRHETKAEWKAWKRGSKRTRIC